VNQPPASAGPTAQADWYASLPPDLQAYYAQPPANESTSPAGLGAYGYTSTPYHDGLLITTPDPKSYIVGAVGTPPGAGEDMNNNVANLFNEDWAGQVQNAIQENGGLGNEQDGYLAFSSSMGFVRLRNTNLTPEQNRQLAAISLQTG